jgi:hypothetical protein
MIFDLEHISYIGKTVFDADFGIPQDDRRRHLHIIGQTGTGKSTTLLHLISQDLAMGRGMALLDPHGDLAERAFVMPSSQSKNFGRKWSRQPCSRAQSSRPPL